MVPVNAPEHLVHPRHLDVEKDDIRRIPANALERFVAIRGRRHGAAFSLEVVGQDVADLALVVDDEDSGLEDWPRAIRARPGRAAADASPQGGERPAPGVP